MTSSPRHVMTRRFSLRSPRSLWLLLKRQSRPDDILRSPRRLRRCPPGLSWPDDVFRSLRELLCDFISKVNHDRTMFCVVRLDYVLVSEVNDQTVFSSSWLMWTMSLSTMLIMTRLNHMVLADQMTPVRIIGSTLSKKIASKCFCILPFHLFI